MELIEKIWMSLPLLYQCIWQVWAVDCWWHSSCGGYAPALMTQSLAVTKCNAWGNDCSTCYVGGSDWIDCQGPAWVKPSRAHLEAHNCGDHCSCENRPWVGHVWWSNSRGTRCFFGQCHCWHSCNRDDLTAGYPNRDDANIVYTSNSVNPGNRVEVHGGKATVSCKSGYVWADTKEDGPRDVMCQLGPGDCRYWTYNPYCIKQWCKIPPPLGKYVYAAKLTYRELITQQPCAGGSNFPPSSGYSYTTDIKSTTAIHVDGLMTYKCAENAIFVDKDASDSIVEQQMKTDIKCKAGGGDNDVVKGKDAHWDKNADGDKYDYDKPWDCVMTCVTHVPSAGQTIVYVDSSDDPIKPVLNGDRWKPPGEAQMTCSLPYGLPPGVIDRVTCLEDGTWDNEFSECAFATEVFVNGTATIKCETGYLWVDVPKTDPFVMTCHANNVWIPITATAVAAKHCEPACVAANPTANMMPPNVSDYSTVFNVNGFNYYPLTATVALRCKFGFVLSTDAALNQTVATCTDSNGGLAPAGWIDDTVVCVPTCVPINASQGENYTYNNTMLPNGNYQIDTNVTKTCDNANGYYIELWLQSNFTVCQSNGTWFPDPINDLSKCCPAFDANETMYAIFKYSVQYNPDDGFVRSNGELQVKCPDGWQWVSEDGGTDEIIIICEQGEWSDNLYNCSKIEGPCPLEKSKSEQIQHITSMITSTITNITLLVCCAILLLVFIALMDFSLPRVYHMIEEITLLASLFMVIPARSPTLFDSGAFCDPENPEFQPPALSTRDCHLVSIGLHFMYTAHFLSLFMEAIHNYTYFTHVFNLKSCVNRPTMLMINILVPAFMAGAPVYFFWGTYVNKNTCWVNYDEMISLIVVIPNCVMALTAIILSEATTMVRYPEHAGSNVVWKTSASTNCKGCLIITVLSFFAYMCCSFAVHSINTVLYMVSSILNIILGVMLLIWHTIGSQKARHMMRKMCPCCSWCCKSKISPAPMPIPVADNSITEPDVLDGNNDGWHNIKQNEDDDLDKTPLAPDTDMLDDDEVHEWFDKEQPKIMAPKEPELPPTPPPMVEKVESDTDEDGEESDGKSNPGSDRPEQKNTDDELSEVDAPSDHEVVNVGKESDSEDEDERQDEGYDIVNVAKESDSDAESNHDDKVRVPNEFD